MDRFLRTVFILSALVSFSEAYNILVVFPHNGRSHFNIYQGLFKTLANSGHNLTVISYFPQKKPVPNYRDISLAVEDIQLSENGLGFNDLEYSRFRSYIGISFIKRYMDTSCKQGYENENLWAFLKEKNEFDLILFQIFTSECFMGISTKYNAPVVGNTFFYNLCYRSKTM